MMVTRIMLAGLTLIFSVVAVMGGFFTDQLIGPVEIIAQTPSAYAELRAVYAGGFAGLAFCCLYALRHPDHQRFVFALLSIMLGIFSIARAGSAMVDGPSNAYSSVMHLLESLGFLVVFWQWWRCREPSPDRP